MFVVIVDNFFLSRSKNLPYKTENHSKKLKKFQVLILLVRVILAEDQWARLLKLSVQHTAHSLHSGLNANIY